MIQKIPSYKTLPLILPFSTYEWVNIWHETIGKEWEPYILSVNNEVIAPFAKKDNNIIFAGGDEVADYLDIIGPDDKKIAAWQEIKMYLHGTTLHLHNIPENSSTLKCFPHEKEDTTPMMTLPPTLDKKARHEMERKIRKFEREHPTTKFRDENNPDVLFSLMKLDPRKKEFLTANMEQFFRKIMEKFGTTTILYIDNTPAAAILAFRVGDTLMSYNSGFDEVNFSGAGFYLKAMHIKRAIESGIKTYNFLQGSERYKYDLGGKDFFIYQIDATL
jgi:CelD/BcsL family acetyltransferase involved in cellulose biosynthesis